MKTLKRGKHGDVYELWSEGQRLQEDPMAHVASPDINAEHMDKLGTNVIDDYLKMNQIEQGTE